METPEGHSRRSWPGPGRRPRARRTAGGARAAVLGSLTIPGRPEQVATARTFVSRTLSSHRIGADLDAATLLTSEIVTNAIQHSKSGVDSGTVTIVVIGVPRGVLVEIIDDGSAGTPVVKGDLYAAEGHGLFLVQHLAAQWGYLRDVAGTTVWFHLPADEPQQAPDPARPRGTGPGVITPDGCAVDFYARLTAKGEPDIVHRAAGPGTSILELGCGAGRITHPLIALGHPVVAVDESPEMLAHVRGAETVCAQIQDLALGRRFDVVLLASHLINTDDAAARSGLLAACGRHVAADGAVIIQQHAPAWFAAAADAEDVRDGIIFRMRDVSRPGPGLVSATVEYVDGDLVWTQTFTARRLDDAELAAALADGGLRLDRYLTGDRCWLRAIPGWP